MQRAMLRSGEFVGKARRLGLNSKRAQAAAIGVHESIHGRMLQRQRPVSGPYVIGVLMVVGDESVRRLVQSLFEFDACAEDAA